MRIWSLHPKYLDTKGLVALWRESLLAKKVLEGNTKGYTKHSQLLRFRNCGNSLAAINYYLSGILEEANSRGFKFDSGKIDRGTYFQKIKVTKGQMEFEKRHLLQKLSIRDKSCYEKILNETFLQPHPLFEICEGEIEKWEKINS